METKQDFCVSCGAASEEDHQSYWAESMANYLILLRAKEYGYAESLDLIIEAWRTHALPTCDPLSID